MMTSRQSAKPTVLRLAIEYTSAWKKAPTYSSLNFEQCIPRSARKSSAKIEDLGHGIDERCFLVSDSSKRAVGMLKFLYLDSRKESDAQREYTENIGIFVLPSNENHSDLFNLRVDHQC